MNSLIGHLINSFVGYSSDLLLPLLTVAFALAAVLRTIIYFTVRCEYKFAVEFEKRVHRYLAHEGPQENISSFHQLIKKTLENTYYEIFELKKKYRRRRLDNVTTITDRIFLIQEGTARLIKDTLSQTQYLRKGARSPRFIDVSKYVFGANPVFNKVLGVLPMGVFNDILNILPGIFVIGGIFGNFLGVMQALPQLSNMDIANVEATKKVMDAFLLHVAFSMGTSIVGIGFSVIMTILNTWMNPEGIYITMVNKFTSSMEFLWNDTDTNELPLEEAGDKDRRIVPAVGKARGTLAKPEAPHQNISDPLLDAWTPDGEAADAPAKPSPQFNLDNVRPLNKKVDKRDKDGSLPMALQMRLTPKVEVSQAVVSKEALEAASTVDAAKVNPYAAEIVALEKRLKILKKERTRAREDKDEGLLTEAEWQTKEKDFHAEQDRIKRELEVMGEASSEAA